MEIILSERREQTIKIASKVNPDNSISYSDPEPPNNTIPLSVVVITWPTLLAGGVPCKIAYSSQLSKLLQKKYSLSKVTYAGR